jgi:hypothetical protein
MLSSIIRPYFVGTDVAKPVLVRGAFPPEVAGHG